MAERLVDNLNAPLRVSREVGDEIANHFAAAVRTADNERIPMKTRWERAHKLFEGIRPEKTTPFVGCANTNVPLVATHASAIHARFMSALFPAGENFWTVKARRPDLQDFADAASDYLDWSARNEMGLYEAVRDAAWDAIKLNLGVLKVRWVREMGPIRTYKVGADSRRVLVEVDGVVKNHPVVEAIPPHLFVWSPGATSIQTADWVAQIHRLTPMDIRHMYKTSQLLNGEDVVKGTSTYAIDDILQRQIERNEGIFAPNRELVTLYEVWGKWEIGGRLEELRLFVQPDTATMPVLMINPVLGRRRPIVGLRLETREHSITGIGVADMIGDLNEEMTTIHNQTIDATSVSICQMFGVRPGTPAWDALEKIHPGKRVPITGADDIKEIGLGPLKASSLPLEEYARSYGERRTGISDFGLGREPSPARRGTATGTLAIIQEGNRKFDYQISDFRQGLSEVGLLALSMIQQVYPEGRQIDVLGADGVSFSKINLAFPQDIPLDTALLVEVQTNNAAINRQVRTQNAITQFQLIMSFFAQAFQLGQMLASPGLPPPLVALGVQMAKGGTIAMKDILTAFENRKVDEILPDLEEIYGQIGSLGLARGFAQTAGLGGPGGDMSGAGPSGGSPGGGGPQPPSIGGLQGGGPLGASGPPRLGGPPAVGSAGV